MSKGIIYLMTSVVSGLIKIGKTGSSNFEQRMYNLEHDGYRNVTGLKRAFAIEVDDYDDKETMLHTIFEKSRVADTELFALDINIAIQLLSSFDGTVIYPKLENKSSIFDEATETENSKNIPDGTYYFERKKNYDGKTVKATAIVQNGKWTLLKGGSYGLYEETGVSQKAKATRNNMPINSSGYLMKDYDLGECTPSHAGTVVFNGPSNGWKWWHTADGKSLDIYKNSPNHKNRIIPDGKYQFNRMKLSDDRMIQATALIQNGRWKLLEGSILGINEDAGMSQKARIFRATMPISESGVLLEDVDLGACSPSYAGCIVMNASNNGWEDWKTEDGQSINIFRK